jgi:hypothetical protein
MLSVPEEQAFIEIFTQFDQIARVNAAEINRRIGNRWQTSHAKMLTIRLSASCTHAIQRRAGAASRLP